MQPRCVWAPGQDGNFDDILKTPDPDVIAQVKLQGMKFLSQAWLDYDQKLRDTMSGLDNMAEPEDRM